MIPQSIAEAVLAAERLEAFPRAAARILKVVENPNSSILDLERAVADDPSVSARLVKTANSPYFGMSRTIGNLRDALMMLGFRATHRLAITMATVGRAPGPFGPTLWMDALATGAACRAVCRAIGGRVDEDEAQLAGLLHDIGILVLLRVDPAGENRLLKEQWASGDLLAAERARYGFDHAELGAACLERWQFPVTLARAVATHHVAPDAMAKAKVEPFQVVVALGAVLARPTNRAGAREYSGLIDLGPAGLEQAVADAALLRDAPL